MVLKYDLEQNMIDNNFSVDYKNDRDISQYPWANGIDNTNGFMSISCNRDNMCGHKFATENRAREYCDNTYGAPMHTSISYPEDGSSGVYVGSCDKSIWTNNSDYKDCCTSGKPGEPVFGDASRTIQAYKCAPNWYRFSNACENQMDGYCMQTLLKRNKEGTSEYIENGEYVCNPIVDHIDDSTVLPKDNYNIVEDALKCNIWYNNLTADRKIEYLSKYCKGFRLNEDFCKNTLTKMYGADSVEKQFISEQSQEDIDNINKPVGLLVSNIRDYCRENINSDFCKKIGKNYNSYTTTGLFTKKGTSGYSNILSSELENICRAENGDQLSSDVCREYCSTNVLGDGFEYVGGMINPSSEDKKKGYLVGGLCGGELKKYCKNKICNGTSDNCDIKIFDNDESLKEICGCMLPNEYYEKVKQQFEDRFKGKVKSEFDLLVSRPDCNFKYCSSATTPIIYKSTHINDKESKNCPINNACIQNIEYNVSGDIIDSVLNPKQDMSCQFNYNTDDGKYCSVQKKRCISNVENESNDISEICRELKSSGEYINNNRCTPISSDLFADPCRNYSEKCIKPENALSKCGGLHQFVTEYPKNEDGNFDCSKIGKSIDYCSDSCKTIAGSVVNNAHTKYIKCSDITNAVLPCGRDENNNVINCLIPSNSNETCIIDNPSERCKPGEILETRSYTTNGESWNYQVCTPCGYNDITYQDRSKCISCPIGTKPELNNRLQCISDTGECEGLPYHTEKHYYPCFKDNKQYQCQTQSEYDCCVIENKVCDTKCGPQDIIITDILNKKRYCKECDKELEPDEEKKQCVLNPMNCPSGYILDQESKDKCKSCISGRTNRNKTMCETECTGSSIPDDNGFECINCNASGKIVDPISKKCISCGDNKIIYFPTDADFSNTCIYDYTKCRDGFGMSDDNQHCNENCWDNKKEVYITDISKTNKAVKCRSCPTDQTFNINTRKCEKNTENKYYYDIDSNTCKIYISNDYNGEYNGESKTQLYDNIDECANKNILYSCQNGKCIQNKNGKYKLGDCEKACQKSISGYNCVNGFCIATIKNNPDYTSLDECKKQCEKSGKEDSSKNIRIIVGICVGILFFALLFFIYKRYNR